MISYMILQIVLESLPISSSGHLALFEHFACMGPISTDLMYALHAPTALILAIYWRASWLPIICAPVRHKKIIITIFILGFLAEAATVICYAAITRLAPSDAWLPLGFAITGVLLLLQAARLHAPEAPPLDSGSKTSALLIGAAQGLAAFPGLSRLGVTYSVGVLLGMRPMRSFAFSCMIQWPLIAVAAAKGCYDLWSQGAGQLLSNMDYTWGPGLALACLLSYGALCCVQWCITTGRMWIFGVYLLALAPFVWFMVKP